MSRKHFQAAARAVRFAGLGDTERRAVAENLAAEFSAFNPAFDRTRFLRACGV